MTTRYQARPIRGPQWHTESQPSRWVQRLKVALGTLALLATCIVDVRF